MPRTMPRGLILLRFVHGGNIVGWKVDSNKFWCQFTGPVDRSDLESQVPVHDFGLGGIPKNKKSAGSMNAWVSASPIRTKRRN